MVETKILKSIDGKDRVATSYLKGEVIILKENIDPTGWWVREANPVRYSLWCKEWCEQLGYDIDQIVATGFKTEQEALEYKEQQLKLWNNA